MIIEDLLDGVVKLEFGNREQIECIDSFREAQKEAQKGLKKYRAIFHFSGSADVEIEAYDEVDAREKAHEAYMDGDLDVDDLVAG